MSLLRENWYSMGLWAGQFLIAWRCQVLGLMHLVFFFCAIYFPVELWIKKRSHFKYRNIFVTSFLAVAYFVRSEKKHELHLVLSVLFLVYTSLFSGLYWKRAPIPGVDFDDTTMTKEERKKMNLRRSPSYHGILSNFVWRKKKVNQHYNKTFHQFIHTRSSSRAPLRAPCMGVFDDVEQLEQFQQQQKVAEILKQSEGLSKEELAAEIIRQICESSAEATLPFKHPMAFGPSGSPETPGESEERPALTPGHFTCSRSIPPKTPATVKMTNPRIHELRKGEPFQSRTPSVRNHFHY